MLLFVFCLVSIVPAMGAAQTPSIDTVVSGYVAAFNAGETPMASSLGGRLCMLDLDGHGTLRRMKAWVR
jgi:hypothetical protein